MARCPDKSQVMIVGMDWQLDSWITSSGLSALLSH